MNIEHVVPKYHPHPQDFLTAVQLNRARNDQVIKRVAKPRAAKGVKKMKQSDLDKIIMDIAAKLLKGEKP